VEQLLYASRAPEVVDKKGRNSAEEPKHHTRSPEHSCRYNANRAVATVQVQGKNIIAYAEYLVSRAAAYGATKVDYVRAGEGRLKKLTVEKGLLRETESVQDQIRALLKCDVSVTWASPLKNVLLCVDARQ
jgi:hypothetical protein